VPADPAQWSVDPFGGEIKDGMLWGRGAVDMKNMDAMILTALGDVLAGGGQPERDLVIAFFADEENGGGFGSHFLVREHPELFAGASEAISEVGGYSIDIEGKPAYLLQTGEKAMIWARLVAEAPPGHGSRLVARNAVTELAEAVAKIGRFEFPVQLTQTTRELIDELGRILGTDPEQVGPDELVLRTGSAAGFITATLRNTANPTMLTAGYKSNVIPERAEACVDIRPLPGQEDAVLAQLAELIGDRVRIELVTRDTGLENPTHGELVDAIGASIERHDPGVPVLPYLMPAGTDNKALSPLGIRGYGFAPLKLPATLDFPALFHGIDERVPLDALTFGRAVLADLLASY
jgi:acetylornithine deacetylase/succinyl-diaminopimelate desuccinylase-like protein